MPKEKTETRETTPIDLDAAMTEGLERFQGELEDEATREATEPADGPRRQEGPSEETAQAKDENTEAPEEEDASQTKTKPLRFKTHEAAEEGFRHLQGEKTRLELELKAYKEQKAAKQTEESVRQMAADAAQKFKDFSLERNKKFQKDLEELDPDDDGYEDRVAELWTDRDSDIYVYQQELLNNQARPAPQPDTGQVQEEDGASDLIAYLEAQAQEAGIDPADKHFQLVCKNTPAQDAQGNPIPYEDQVKEAIDKTLQYHAEFRDRQRESAQARGSQAQEEDIPLGSSTPESPHTDRRPQKPMSLGDAVSAALDEQRI